jgi:hypothetical protein
MNRKHDWSKIDPLLFTGVTTMADLSRKTGVSYRQITNRKYNLRDKIQRLSSEKKTKELKKMLAYLNVKKVDHIPFLNI